MPQMEGSFMLMRRGNACRWRFHQSRRYHRSVVCFDLSLEVNGALGGASLSRLLSRRGLPAVGLLRLSCTQRGGSEETLLSLWVLMDT